MSTPDPKMVALLAEHAPTYTEWAADPTATFYCKPCSEARGDWVTWTPEHVAQALADAGIGDVAAVEAERDEWKRTARHTREWALGEVRAADARVAAVVEPVLALADEFDTVIGFRGAATALRAAVESTDAPAALARIKAEAWAEGKHSEHDAACRLGDGDCICANPYGLTSL